MTLVLLLLACTGAAPPDDSAPSDSAPPDDGPCWREESDLGGPEIAVGDLGGTSDAPVMGCCSIADDARSHGIRWTAPRDATWRMRARFADLGVLQVSDTCAAEPDCADTEAYERTMAQGESVVLTVRGYGAYTLGVVDTLDAARGEEACADGIDDDLDAQVDCEDADCDDEIPCRG